MPNRKECYKDLEKYKKTRYNQRKRYYAKTAFRTKYRYWTKEEEDAVIAHKISDTELSDKINRSVTAIQNKRRELKAKLKKKNDGD